MQLFLLKLIFYIYSWKNVIINLLITDNRYYIVWFLIKATGLLTLGGLQIKWDYTECEEIDWPALNLFYKRDT